MQVWAESTNEGLSQSELEARNLTVLSEFDNDELQSVDAVVGHLYYKEGRHSGEVGEHEYSNIDNMVGTSVALLNVWQEAVGNDKDLDLAFSEWNVNHNSDESFGLVQVGYMISMFDEFVRQGVDSLNFWSAQYHPTSLAVDGGTLSPVGEIFCYMRSNLIGSNPTDLTFDQSGFDAFAYSSDFGIEVIIVSTSEHSETLSLSYDSLSANLQLDDALLLGVDPESCDGIYKNVVFENCWFEPDAHPIWTTLDNSLNSIDNEIVFSVGAYEVVCLSFLYTDIDEQSELNPDDELIDLVFDVINGNDVSDYINGGGRSDLISGLQGHDTLIGGQGADTVFGGLDDDQVEGKSGHDYILGENGNDTLSGDTDRDTIDGGDGDDSVQGGQGSDFLLGDNGKDYLSGGDGDDWIEGGDGGDTISGGASGDALFGGDGGDSISGNQGSDEISGDNGADLLKGNGGHDMIFGGSGNDTIHGGEGRDTICGDAGNDVLFGELGADVFVYTGGQDVVRDLTLVDEIEFGEILGESPHGADAYSVIRQESSVVFDFGNGNSLEIIGGFSVDELLEISTFL